MYVAGASMAHAQQPMLLDMLPVCIASDPQRSQAHGLLSAFLARRADWEALKCIRSPHTLLLWHLLPLLLPFLLVSHMHTSCLGQLGSEGLLCVKFGV